MRLRLTVLLTACALVASLHAQVVHLSGRAQIAGGKSKTKNSSDVVIWLTPRDGTVPTTLPQKQYRLVQQDKHFEPHLLVVPLGASVEFPNHDPFFHNVFSVYEGKPFDLGLYESGSSKSVRFDRPGPSYIFCNIHPEMSAVVLVLKTPYFARTNPKGEYELDVPPGDYELGIWYEHTRPQELKSLARRVTITPNSTDLPHLTLSAAPSLAEGHKNKYGQTYEQPPRYPVP